ncbi:alcohol acetyltransferase-domain-containing protein [Xylariomycetidae sp. FL0641]|nr:alcohol acetyltransferase-domain-containing protein [Xylariomycetidae sp. FL0641]
MLQECFKGQKSAHKAKVIRPLTNLDVYHSSLHALGYARGTIVACRYGIPPHVVEKSHDAAKAVQDTVYRAVALTVLDHPRLQVGLLDENSRRPKWIELESIDLDYHIDWMVVGPSEDYAARVQEVTHERADSSFGEVESRPGWNLSILQQEGHAFLDAIFCWNHAALDGVSGKLFHETLLRHLNSVQVTQDLTGLRDTTLQLPSVADRFPPPPEKIGKFPVTLGFALSTAWRELKPACLVSAVPSQARWAPIQATPHGTESSTLYIEPTTFTGVLDACRKHQTTITALLNTLVAVSLALQLTGDKVPHGERADALSAMTPIDLRRFMPSKPKKYPWHEPSATMDNEMTLAYHTFDTPLLTSIRQVASSSSSAGDAMARLEPTVWTVAACVRRDINDILDSGLRNSPLGLMGLVADWRAQHASEARKPRAYAFGVSNLGAIDGRSTGDGDGGWAITRAMFGSGAVVTSTAFTIAAISVKGGDFCVNVSWQVGTVDAAFGEQLARDMEGWLRYLAKR